MRELALDRPLWDGAAASGALLPVAIRDVSLAIGGAQLIDGLSLTLRPGLRHAIIGPNGAGKSLTLRLLQGLLQPTGGEIAWSGGQGQAMPVHRRSALVFQRPVLLRRSVVANLDHALKVYGVPRAARPARIADWLERASLTHLAGRPARVLSGGEQQRLCIARALAAEPALLLLDEPTASLDPSSTARIEALIDHAHTAGVTVALVTHDMGQARRLADQVIFLHRGQALEETPAAAFFARPRSQAARAYLAGDLVL